MPARLTGAAMWRRRNCGGGRCRAQVPSVGGQNAALDRDFVVARKRLRHQISCRQVDDGVDSMLFDLFFDEIAIADIARATGDQRDGS
jgi:hypothetical protein